MGKVKEGSIVAINLSDNRTVFGRLVPSIATIIAVYSYIHPTDKINDLDIRKILTSNILFYCGIYRDLLKKGIFKVVDIVPFSIQEVSDIPPFFLQSINDIQRCKVFWIDGREREAKPEECVGLEKSSVWDEKGLRKRIEDTLDGKKNPNVELNKVILSANDPRATSNPTLLRWSFEKQAFYLLDNG